MALSTEQVTRLKKLTGPAAYDLYVSTYASSLPIEDILTDNKGNLTETAIVMLDSLASYAESVKEVKVGPITIKLDSATYRQGASRLRRLVNQPISASYVVKNVGVP